MIVGSLLALMGFLLANSVSATYLRADYLPEPAASEIWKSTPIQSRNRASVRDATQSQRKQRSRAAV